MSAPIECPHSPVLTPDTCSICIGPKRPVAVVERKRVGDPRPSRCEIVCAGCKGSAVKGVMVQQWSDGLFYHHDLIKPCRP